MRGAARQPVDPVDTREWLVALRPASPLDPPINLASPFLIVLRLLKLLSKPLYVSVAELHARMKQER